MNVTAKVKQIVLACQCFQDDYEGRCPDSLDQLYPEYLTEKIYLPRDGAEPVHLVSGLTIHDSTLPLVYTFADKEGNQVVVGYADGRVETIPHSELQIPSAEALRYRILPAKVECIRVEVSAGELLDKVSILKIKQERIADPEKIANVTTELKSLEQAVEDSLVMTEGLEKLCAELKSVNEKLWEIEDEIRECEAQQDFGSRFVELARDVYKTNDLRADIKKRVNRATGSRLVEEKSYSDYLG